MDLTARRPTSDDASTEPAPSRRRIHRATWMFAVLAAAALGLLNLAAREDLSPEFANRGEFGPRMAEFVPRVEHGWPWTFACREGLSLYDVPLWRRKRWDVADGLSWFDLTQVLINAAACVVVVAGLSYLFERWRRRRRKALQIHLGELLFLMTVAGVYFGLRTSEHRATEKDRAVLAAVDEEHGRTANHTTSISHRAQWERPEPSWWGHLTGQRPLRVTGVEVRGERLQPLVGLGKLKTLHLHRTVSPDELLLLPGMPQLEGLHICFLRGDGPAPRPPLVLPPLPRLRGLNAFGADFRGEGLERLTSLEVLDLSQTQVDDAALSRLSGLTRLKWLALDHTRVNGEGLARLAGLPQLERLSLRSCHLNEAGIRELARLKQLQDLDLSGCRLSHQGIEALATALPSCNISTARIRRPRRLPPIRTPPPAIAPKPAEGAGYRPSGAGPRGGTGEPVRASAAAGGAASGL